MAIPIYHRLSEKGGTTKLNEHRLGPSAGELKAFRRRLDLDLHSFRVGNVQPTMHNGPCKRVHSSDSAWAEEELGFILR